METLKVGQKLTGKQVGRITLGYQCYMLCRPKDKVGTAEELDMMENYRIASSYIQNLDKENYLLSKAYYDSFKFLQLLMVDADASLCSFSDCVRNMEHELETIYNAELTEHFFYGEPQKKFKFMKENMMYSTSLYLNHGGRHLMRMVERMDKARAEMEHSILNYNCYEMLLDTIKKATGCEELKLMSKAKKYKEVIGLYKYYKSVFDVTISFLGVRAKEKTLSQEQFEASYDFIEQVFKPSDFKDLELPKERKQICLKYLNEDITLLSRDADKLMGIIYRGEK